jgi:TolA-binding protein
MPRCLAALSLALAVAMLSCAPAGAQEGMADDSLRFADGLYRQGLFEMAVREYRDFVRKYGDHPLISDARLRLGDCLIQTGELGEAAKVLSELLQQDPDYKDRDEVAHRLGRSLVETGRGQEAVRVLEAIVGEPKRSPPRGEAARQVVFWLGEACYRTGQHEKAHQVLSNLLRADLGPELERPARLTAGWAAFKSNQPEPAISHFAKILSMDVSDELRAECHHVIGECCYTQKNYRKALEHYAQAASMAGPFQEKAAVARGWCLLEAGRPAEAGDAFRQAAESFPQGALAPEARLRGGVSYFHASKDEEAKDLLLRAADERDVSIAAEALYWLAQVLVRQGQLDDAVAFLSRVRGQDEDLHLRASLTLGEVLFRLGRHQEAIRAFTRVTSRLPPENGSPLQGAEAARWAYALHAQALGHQALAQHEQALALEENLVRRFPESEHVPASLLVQGEALYNLGRHQEAAERLGILVRDHARSENVPAALYKQGHSLLALKDDGGARRSFQTLAQRYPKHELTPEARKLAAECLARMGNEKEAIAELSRVADAEGEVGDLARLEAARLQKSTRDLAAAAASFEKLAASAGDETLRARAHYERGEILYESGSYAESARAFASSMELSRDEQLTRTARYGRAYSLYRAGEIDAAVEETDRLLRDKGIDEGLRGSALHLLGASHQKAGRWDAAVESYGALLKEQPRSKLAYEAAFGRGVCLAQAGKTQEAIRALNEILKKYEEGPANDRVLYELAFAYGATGQDVPMAVTFRKLVDDYPKSYLAPEVRFRLGEFHYGRGELEQASALYADAVSLGDSPVLDKALYKKGWADRKRGEHEKAEAAFGMLVEKCSLSELRGESLFLRGESLRELGRPQEAEAYYRKLIADYPKHELRERADLSLALSLVEAEAWNDAVKVLNRHRQTYPESERIFEVDFWLGKSLVATGRHDSAIQCFRRVTASHRGETAARSQYEIGNCFLEKGDAQQALSEYLKVRFLYGHVEWVAAAMLRCGQCFERLEQTDRALETYRELVEKYPEEESAKKARSRISELDSM